MSPRTLVLSPYPEKLPIQGARSATEPLDEALVDGIDWIVSYGYRQIIREPYLSRFAGRIVNLHIALLPWNRGADPNLWSWVEDTPKGVSIHLVDAGIDTGPLLAQREVPLGLDHTLRSSHAALQESIERLFAEVWPTLDRIVPKPQPPGGSFHLAKDRERIALPLGWDTPVRDLRAPHLSAS